MKAVISYINSDLGDFNLLAPTGRAANIIGKKSNFFASTVHSHIYSISEIKDSEGRVVKLKFNCKANLKDYKEVFFVDEASMVSEKAGESEQFISDNSLLHDFIRYVKQGHENSKVIFIGDSYQLPPVNSANSRALEADYLRSEFGLKVMSFELTEVMRQANDSYVLRNAHRVKNAINQKMPIPKLEFKSQSLLDNQIDQYVNEIKEFGYERSIVLAWKNKTNEEINKQVRKRLFADSEKPIVLGEHFILSQGYFTSDSYIPNGTFVKVIEIVGREEVIAGFRFATVKLHNTDSGEDLEGEYKVNLDFLKDGLEALDQKKMKKLWHDRYRSNKDLQKSKNKKDDEYLSALQVNYAYSITVHKAQGGEWSKVYLHPEQPTGVDGKKLLYTAITRAKKELIEINRY